MDVFYERVANRSLTFNSSHTSFRERISITVVLNDTMPLIHQEFELSLSLGEPDPRVVLEPETATVKIFEVHGEGEYRHPMYLTSISKFKALHHAYNNNGNAMCMYINFYSILFLVCVIQMSSRK